MQTGPAIAATGGVVGAEEAARLAREHFGLDGRAARLDGYADQNFAIDCGERSYVLKLVHPDADPHDVDLECAALARLATRAASLATPAVVATSDGRLHARVTCSLGERAARVVTFLPGTLMAVQGRLSGRALRRLGAGLAEVGSGLDGLEHPRRHRTLQWDLRRAEWTAGALDAIGDPARRALVERALLQFRASVATRIRDLPQGLVHGDANDHNVLVSDGVPTGLIDFGDMVQTCRVFDPAIAATYAAFHRPDDPVDALAEVAAGYHSVSPLASVEIEVFGDAVRMRAAVTVVSAALAARQDHAAEYAFVSEAPAWELLSTLAAISPAEIVERVGTHCGVTRSQTRRRSAAELAAARRRVLGSNLGLSYEEPLHVVRGAAQYLFDEHGWASLDGVNNVCHVGHCHPGTVAAGAKQMATLNTNTRYLHDNVLRLAERLLAKLPDHLQVCFFVCSGSEANELALRLARKATGRRDVLVLDHAYHGNTTSLVELSPYKFDGPGGSGRAPWVHVTACPDPYRDAAGVGGPAFAEHHVRAALERAAAGGAGIAALFAESLPGCAGQVVPPPGYLARAFELVREAGGVAVADEVQCGFGRVGPSFWAFAEQGALPDIVTLGKPMGNGHPVGAVVTTRAIADAFADGMEYFNTFGGNPVSCAVALAVLDALSAEGLPEHAARTGAGLLELLAALADRHPTIGDVRGLGLYVGVELVADRRAKTPATDLAASVVEHCRRAGVLLSRDGPRRNVLKIKPPLPFDAIDARLLVAALDRALTELGSGNVKG